MDKISQKDSAREVNRIILWSAGILTIIAVFGLSVWSDAGVAVFFDRISASFANCF
ncbi:hypothetical protein [uncultured Cohaesibacter sp.]|uniref:hypothetical protein n=1 Tax=uncultured Cohaesibacter sp. TaxID=1002546 RepID=UPI0029C8C9A2|nr:hypothetical protein [uncultured Cohaesibacter sp.]